MTGKWEWGNDGFGRRDDGEEGRGPFDFPQGERGGGGPGVGASGGGESLFAPTRLGGGSRVRDPILTFPFVRGRDYGAGL